MERGRPRQFDEDEALDAALRVFWQQGYQGASMAALTEAMGINKPSLYRAFGGKEALYKRTLERYCDSQLRHHAQRLENEPDLKQAVGAFLHSIVNMLTNPDVPAGCMVVNSSVAVGSGNLPQNIEDAIGEVVQQFVFTQLHVRFLREAKTGRLDGTAINGLVNYFATVMAGMAVMARLGMEKAELEGVIDAALLAIPSSG